MKCLLVELDVETAALISATATDFGFTVTCHTQIRAAAAALERESFELLVVNLDLPDASAFELCRQVRARDNPRTHILAVMGKDTDDDLQAALDAGADDYLARPIESKRVQIRLAVAARQVQVVAQRQAAEASLRASEERYRLLAENATDIISRHSPDGTYQYVSPAARLLMGYEPEELDGRNPLEFIHSDDLPGLQDPPYRLVDHHKVFTLDYRLRHKDGRWLWFESTCKVIMDSATGEPTQVVCVSRDISERKRQERALLESEAKWRGLVENLPDMIMVIDRDGTILFINRTIPSLTVEGVTGTSCFNYTVPQARPDLEIAIRRVFDEGKADHFEVEGPVGENEMGWYSCRMGPLKIDGKNSAAVVIIRETTASKRAAEALFKEQALLKRLLDLQERERQLVAYEIHDGLAQYLTGSLMHLEACNATTAGDKQIGRQDFERGLSLLRTAVGEARRLISGLRPPILDEAGIVAAVEYLISESREAIPDIRFTHNTTFDRLPPQLECSVFRIVQEALTNARRHSMTEKAAIALDQRGGRLIIEIRDWGIGFDPTQVREERFGLQGIRERARLLGGTATIDSTPGNGTRVVVDIPLEQDE